MLVPKCSSRPKAGSSYSAHIDLKSYPQPLPQHVRESSSARVHKRRPMDAQICSACVAVHGAATRPRSVDVLWGLPPDTLAHTIDAYVGEVGAPLCVKRHLHYHRTSEGSAVRCESDEVTGLLLHEIGGRLSRHLCRIQPGHANVQAISQRPEGYFQGSAYPPSAHRCGAPQAPTTATDLAHLHRRVEPAPTVGVRTVGRAIRRSHPHAGGAEVGKLEGGAIGAAADDVDAGARRRDGVWAAERAHK
eukprot:834000-Pyramimonas_sp.AAC.1